MSLEVVRYTEHGASQAVTLELALDGTLAHPFTVAKADFLSFPNEEEREDFLKRSARSMIDVYGDARDGRILSDLEVQERTAH